MIVVKLIFLDFLFSNTQFAIEFNTLFVLCEDNFIEKFNHDFKLSFDLTIFRI